VDGRCEHDCVHGADRCNGTCTHLAWDPENCGACNNVCRGSTCQNGTCQPNNCVPNCPTHWCGGDGCGGTCGCPGKFILHGGRFEHVRLPGRFHGLWWFLHRPSMGRAKLRRVRLRLLAGGLPKRTLRRIGLTVT
jgi:hypothetical protein